MKIENGKLIFEQVFCWDCHGSKVVTRYDSCPHNHKQVRQFGGKCPCCGSKNKHSHKSVGEHQEPCRVCNETGSVTQDSHYFVSADEWAAMLPHFNFTVIRTRRAANFNEGYLGIGILYGVTDYVDWTAKSDEEALAVAKDAAYHPTQPIQFINRETLEVNTNLGIILLRDGWHVICLTGAK